MLCLYYISSTLYELYTLIKMKLKLKFFKNHAKNNTDNEERPIFRWTIYYIDSKLRISSTFRPKNSNFYILCCSYILSSSFGFDKISTNLLKISLIFFMIIL